MSAADITIKTCEGCQDKFDSDEMIVIGERPLDLWFCEYCHNIYLEDENE